jgi:hypothetical protein
LCSSDCACSKLVFPVQHACLESGGSGGDASRAEPNSDDISRDLDLMQVSRQCAWLRVEVDLCFFWIFYGFYRWSLSLVCRWWSLVRLDRCVFRWGDVGVRFGGNFFVLAFKFGALKQKTAFVLRNLHQVACRHHPTEQRRHVAGERQARDVQLRHVDGGADLGSFYC